MMDIGVFSGLDSLAAPQRSTRDVLGFQEDVLRAAREARRELDELEKIQSALGLDALERAHRAIGWDFIDRAQRNMRSLGLDYDYQLKLQRQLLGENPAWLDPVLHLQREMERYGSARMPWYCRDNVDLHWLFEIKKISSIWAEHRRVIEKQIAASLLRPREPQRPRPPPGKEKTFLTAATLLRVASRQLRAIRTRVQSMQASLLRHFLYATRFTASIEPALG